MEQMITNLGFPIAACVATGSTIFLIIKNFLEKDKVNQENTNKIIENMRTDAKEDRNMYRETITKFDDKLDKFSVALENNNHELGAIKEDIKTIKEKVGV